jgi:thiol-disulfide isomerase/thioredoxin
MTASPTTAPRRGPRSFIRARAWPWLLLAAAIGLWTSWGGGGSGPAVGELAPALQAPWTSSDEPFELAAQRGHVTVLAFWATWCPACRAEGPALARLSERIAPEGDSVIGVSIDDAPLESIASAARGFGMTYPIAKGTRADTARFEVDLLPTIIVVAPDGRVAQSFSGTVGEARLLEAVEAARTSR